MSQYQTRGVLAGAYRGSDARSFLTHTANIEVSYDSAICNRVKEGNLADEYSDTPGLDEPPTCKACLARDPRFKK